MLLDEFSYLRSSLNTCTELRCNRWSSAHFCTTNDLPVVILQSISTELSSLATILLVFLTAISAALLSHDGLIPIVNTSSNIHNSPRLQGSLPRAI